MLIISYTFPPQSGIGGRRWAKFFKYFRKHGIDARVITTHNLDSESHWKIDVEPFEEFVDAIPSGYPEILRKVPTSIQQKIDYRYSKAKLLVQSRGNVYDHSVNWGPHLLPKVREYIDDGYTKIIATCGPFHYLSELLKLRGEFPFEITLVADFRDPWANNKTSFGFSELPSKRLKYEVEKELNVINGYDYIVSVAEEMTTYFKERVDAKQTANFHTIINGFDREENVGVIRERPADELRFVFVGTVYNKTFKHAKALALALDKGLPAKTSFHFYGDMSSDIRRMLSAAPGVHVHGKVSLQDAKSAIANSDVCMLFLTDDITYSFSTKFCEYISFKKPIWVISNEGFTSEFVSKESIGFHSQPTESSISEFFDHLSSEKVANLDYSEFKDDEFNVETLALKYLDILGVKIQNQ